MQLFKKEWNSFKLGLGFFIVNMFQEAAKAKKATS